MLERRCSNMGIKCAQAIQSAQRMDRRRIKANRIDVLAFRQLGERRDYVDFPTFDQQTLGLRAPKHVVAFQSGNELIVSRFQAP